MNNLSTVAAALLLTFSATQTLVAATQGPNHLQGSAKQVVIDYSKLDAAQGWDQIAAGVYQRIDSDGTISSVSMGDAGRRYDLGVAKSNLALVKQKLENAMQRRQPTKDLLNQIIDLEDTVQRLTQQSDVPTGKGTAHVEDQTGICHNTYGVIWADFATSPRVGGGTTGSVTSDVRFLQCQYSGFGCNPLSDAIPSTGYDGRTWSSSRAENSGGANWTTQNSNNGSFVNLNLSPLPRALTTVSTKNVADSTCTLRAGGGVQTTVATSPYQTCSLYKSFTITRTCAQIP